MNIEICRLLSSIKQVKIVVKLHWALSPYSVRDGLMRLKFSGLKILKIIIYSCHMKEVGVKLAFSLPLFLPGAAGAIEVKEMGFPMEGRCERDFFIHDEALRYIYLDLEKEESRNEGVVSGLSGVRIYSTDKITLPRKWKLISNFLPKEAGLFRVVESEYEAQLNSSKLAKGDEKNIVAQVVFVLRYAYFEEAGELVFIPYSQYVISGSKKAIRGGGKWLKVNKNKIVEKIDCLNIYPRWCGDGIVSENERCDDGADNGKDGKCTLTCN